MTEIMDCKIMSNFQNSGRRFAPAGHYIYSSCYFNHLLGMEMESKEIQLVEATLKGDKAAYGELYDRYAALIRAICYDTAQSVPSAQDLAQEVFLRAYQKLSSLRQPEKFGGWLVGIARRMCREYRRTKARDRHVFVEQFDDHPAVQEK